MANYWSQAGPFPVTALRNIGTSPVGSLTPPNGYGLYDMTGNAWQWAADWYGFDHFSEQAKLGRGRQSPRRPKVLTPTIRRARARAPARHLPPSTTTARSGPSSRCTSSSLFALDRVKALAPQHPEWKDKEPFASLLKGDLKGALAGGERACSRSSWRRTPA